MQHRTRFPNVYLNICVVIAFPLAPGRKYYSVRYFLQSHSCSFQTCPDTNQSFPPSPTLVGTQVLSEAFDRHTVYLSIQRLQRSVISKLMSVCVGGVFLFMEMGTSPDAINTPIAFIDMSAYMHVGLDIIYIKLKKFFCIISSMCW